MLFARTQPGPLTRVPPRRRTLLLSAFLLLTLAFVSAPAYAQGRGGGGPGGGGPGGGGPGGGGRFPGGKMRGPMMPPPERESTTGLWWHNSRVAQFLGINSDQQHRMDDVFNAHKDNLVSLYKNLQHEESQLEKVTRVKNPDEATIFAQIDRVTQARGDLEKANAHYLLELRKQMTADQIGHLDDFRPAD
jgi:Spy/CpxP family protein refolding chaperone